MNLSELAKPTLERPRVDGDIDIVSLVCAEMMTQGYALVEMWCNESEIVEARDRNPDLQRFLISRNLRIKLGMSSVPTSIERFALDASSSNEDYLKNMRELVIPALVKIAKQLQ